jgi:hypothetical protein
MRKLTCALLMQPQKEVKLFFEHTCKSFDRKISGRVFGKNPNSKHIIYDAVSGQLLDALKRFMVKEL